MHPSELLVRRAHGPDPVLLPWRPGAGYDRLEGTKLPVYAFFDTDGTRRGLFSLEALGADVVHLHLVRADEPGHQHGSRFIQGLCDEADSLAVTLDLEVAPQDEDGISEERLIALYEKFGFRRTRAGRKPPMIRLPRRQASPK